MDRAVLKLKSLDIFVMVIGHPEYLWRKEILFSICLRDAKNLLLAEIKPEASQNVAFIRDKTDTSVPLKVGPTRRPFWVNKTLFHWLITCIL